MMYRDILFTFDYFLGFWTWTALFIPSTFWRKEWIPSLTLSFPLKVPAGSKTMSYEGATPELPMKENGYIWIAFEKQGCRHKILWVKSQILAWKLAAGARCMGNVIGSVQGPWQHCTQLIPMQAGGAQDLWALFSAKIQTEELTENKFFGNRSAQGQLSKPLLQKDW